MLKKQATGSLKQSIDKLKERVNTMVDKTDELITATGMPANNVSVPPEGLLENLVKECEEHKFWLNFRKAAPMLFCALMESNP